MPWGQPRAPPSSRIQARHPTVVIRGLRIDDVAEGPRPGTNSQGPVAGVVVDVGRVWVSRVPRKKPTRFIREHSRKWLCLRTETAPPGRDPPP
jgi:hypothetical protein